MVVAAHVWEEDPRTGRGSHQSPPASLREGQGMTLMRIVVPFFGGVHCHAEVLTWQAQYAIGGIECRICAPSPVPAWIGSRLGPLEPPLDETHWEVPDWPADGWGMINSFNSVTIEAIGLEIKGTPPSSEHELLKFDLAVGEWIEAFHDWLSVLAEGPTGFESREIRTKWISEEADKRLSWAHYHAGHIWEPDRISRWQWNHAVQHAADGDEAPFARKLLALAKRDAARADGRNAVIHAATAAECALTNGLTRHLLDENSLTDVHKRLDKYRMLGQRLKLAQELGLKVPTDVREFLLEPRNAVVHAGLRIDDTDAWRAVRAASEIVENFDPLPEHCDESVYLRARIVEFPEWDEPC
jgi:hypothetical protein